MSELIIKAIGGLMLFFGGMAIGHNTKLSAINIIGIALLYTGAVIFNG